MAKFLGIDSDLNDKWEQQNLEILKNIESAIYYGPNGEIYFNTYKWKRDMLECVKQRREMMLNPVIITHINVEKL